MNPFVGLSKVTKKRIDALENFTKEIDFLKERTSELESFAEKSGARLKNLSDGERADLKTIETDEISNNENEETSDTEENIEVSDSETSPETIDTEKVEDNIETSNEEIKRTEKL